MATPTSAAPTTISAALAGVTDETLRAEGVDLGDGPGTDPDDSPDDPKDPGDGNEPAREAAADEPEGGEDAADPKDEEDAFRLSAEEREAIKADPRLDKVYKSLQRAYTHKTMEHSEAVKLAALIKSNPDEFLEAAARMRGHSFTRKGQEPPVAAPAPSVAEVSQEASKVAAEKLEKLFGPEAGPVIRGVFEEFARSVVQGTVAPLQATLQNETQIREVNRLVSEEAVFKSKHKDEITPEIEAEMVALGNSGNFQPGPNTPPGEYLELLHEVVMARRSRTKASADVAERIRRNRQEQEPTRGVSSRGGVGRVSKVGEAKSLADAFKIAQKELEAEGRY